MLRGAADSLLDLTIAPGFSRIGWGARKALGLLGPIDADLTGKRCVVTGANSGLGLEASRQLAALGADVVMVGRNPERLERALVSVEESARAGASITSEVIDLSSLESVRSGAERLLAGSPQIDVLINNAGVLLDSRQVSADGIELTLATNVLGPFLLTELLLPALVAAALERPPARIINVSSGGMYSEAVKLDDLQSAREKWSGSAVYARTKRMQVMLTEYWAEQLADQRIVVSAMHPGWADTPGVESSLPTFHKIVGKALRTPAEGADTITWLAAAEEPAQVSGRFWQDRAVRPVNRRPGTAAKAGDQRLLAEELSALAV
jgi:NAD(P)-dependent dehydrogenase (short-subunit alcohol dehydrogenase family)